MVKQKNIRQIGDHVVLISEKAFSLYIVRGKKNFLIDSGTTALAPRFISSISNALEEVGDANRTIHSLLLTHTHWDHAGAAYELQQKYGFNVITAQRGVELLQKSKVIEFIDRLNQEFKKMVNISSPSVFAALQNLEGVSEGDKIPVDDGCYFEVIDTPGHTRCSVSYLLHPDKILFPGDSTGVIEADSSIKPLFLSSYLDYIHSIEKLGSLDVELLAFPHNPFIEGKEKIRGHMEAALKRAIDIKDKILGYLEEETDISKIADTIYDNEFPAPTLFGPKEAMLINIEAMIKAVSKEVISR